MIRTRNAVYHKILSILLAVSTIITMLFTVSASSALAQTDEDEVILSHAVLVNMPAEVIFHDYSDAVFMLETFNNAGESIRTGSGFFISNTGLAVTNLHVLDFAASATITLQNGDVYLVRGVNAMSEEYNVAVFSIDSDEKDWTYLPLGDSDTVRTGNSVYTIGNPLGYTNTMTAGIVGKAIREVGEETFIQFTAPISFGSGGSPLVNSYGQVVGIASSSFSYGQNLNLAVPINYAKELPFGESIPLNQFRGR